MRSARGAEQQNLSPFVKKVINEGKPFTDSQFPANINSLLDTANANGGLDKRSVEWYKKIEWRRAPEIYLGGCSVFKKGVEPTDIKQGKLADCYLLSVLSALAEIPGRVESLFNTTLQILDCPGLGNTAKNKDGNKLTDDHVLKLISNSIRINCRKDMKYHNQDVIISGRNETYCNYNWLYCYFEPFVNLSKRSLLNIGLDYDISVCLGRESVLSSWC